MGTPSPSKRLRSGKTFSSELTSTAESGKYAGSYFTPILTQGRTRSASAERPSKAGAKIPRRSVSADREKSDAQSQPQASSKAARAILPSGASTSENVRTKEQNL